MNGHIAKGICTFFTLELYYSHIKNTKLSWKSLVANLRPCSSELRQLGFYLSQPWLQAEFLTTLPQLSFLPSVAISQADSDTCTLGTHWPNFISSTFLVFLNLLLKALD